MMNDSTLFQGEFISYNNGGLLNDVVCFSTSERTVEGDYFDGVFKYIQEILMEEDDLDNRPCMFQDCMALQAAEKSFYDALINPPPSVNDRFIDDDFNAVDQVGFQSNNVHQAASNEGNPGGKSPDRGSEGRKKHDRQGDDSSGWNSKQFASSCGDESEQTDCEEGYDKALLCPALSPAFYEVTSDAESENAAWNNQKSCHLKESKRGRPRGSKKGVKANEVVDLTSLLTRCAEAAAAYNSSTFLVVLNKIRQNCSRYGDATARLAYCFANALEARFAGGVVSNALTSTKRISAADFLKAYQLYIAACPFKRMSNIFANKSIAKLTNEASTIHIIDFGILYGFQWPCLIHGISLRPGGPPKLRITGIDFPQPGFRPAERVEETGRRLEGFCNRFNVPFEYRAIAKRWEEISLDDLNIERGEDEILVVNCLYRLKNVPDETAVAENNPRDAVLKLINKINPHYFIHGIVNAMYNASFFTTRFREALFHFSSQFDMFEATMPREDEGRMMFEQEIFGRDIMNVIACEGTERVERPESYKQWQARNQNAGFKQLPLDQNIMKEVKTKVRMFYHRDFLVDENSNWMLQGWKGRIMYALSAWEPVHR